MRVRIDKALKAFRERGEVAYTFDPVPEDVYDRSNCFLDLLDESLNRQHRRVGGQSHRQQRACLHCC